MQGILSLFRSRKLGLAGMPCTETGSSALQVTRVRFSAAPHSLSLLFMEQKDSMGRMMRSFSRKVCPA